MLNLLPSLFSAASSLLPQQGGSLMSDPSMQSAFGSIDNTLAQMQGVADQFRSRPAPLGQSPAYYGGLTSGGTSAQNDRFSRMYDPSQVSADALASLAADPQFGHLFGGGPQASVTQFQAPQQAVPAITNDTISQMLNSGQIDGRTSGVSLSPELQSQALERRLAQRAESQANLNAMRMTPMDYVDPLKRMQAAYDWEYAQQEMAAQNEKNAIARLIAQAEIDSRNQMLQQDASQFDRTMDFKELQAMLQGKATSAQNAFTQEMERDKLGLLERELGMQEAAAAREGQLSQRDVLELLFGEPGQQYGGPSAMLGLLGQLGLDLPEGITIPDSLATPVAAPSGFGQLFGGATNEEARAQLATMSPDDAYRYLRTTGARGRPLSETEALAIVKELHPDLIGSTARNPGGISIGGAIGGGLAGGIPGAIIGSGVDQADLYRYLFGGAATPAANPMPALAPTYDYTAPFGSY